MLTMPIADEPDQLPQQPGGHARRRSGRQRVPAELGADLGQRQRAGGQRPADPGHPLAGRRPRWPDVHPGVRVVHPVHRHLVDPQPGPLGQHQQFGVEEPAGVLDQRQQPAAHVGPHRLEPALRVGEPGEQRAAQHQVVAAGDQLSLGAADHPAVPGQPGSDGHVGVAGDERRDQRQQRVQVGGHVHVQVGHHLGLGATPDGAAAPGRDPSAPAAGSATPGSSPASSAADQRRCRRCWRCRRW